MSWKDFKERDDIKQCLVVTLFCRFIRRITSFWHMWELLGYWKGRSSSPCFPSQQSRLYSVYRRLQSAAQVSYECMSVFCTR